MPLQIPDRDLYSSNFYRRDIDGLRAIAVLAVLLYHYGASIAGGGYVGVDVFFVISGFLIGSHILEELEGKRFSLIAFYEKRIRRIFPALFGVLILTFVAGLFVLFPYDLHQFALNANSVVLFASNLHFYWDINSYSDVVAKHTPLLHTWSLGVEEQFYFFFPLLMMAIARWAKGRFLLVLSVLCTLSFAACLVMVRIESSAAFFLPQYRMWELLVGAVLAATRLPPPGQKWLREALASVGIVLIGIAVVFFGNSTLFPSEYALLPVIGAALILFARCETGVAGAISCNRASTLVGLWSYSLYLIHWPLLVLSQYYAFLPLAPSTKILLFAVNFPLAALFWRYIEQPFRTKNLGRKPRALFLAASGAIVAALAIFLFAAADDGIPVRFSDTTRALFASYTPEQLSCNASLPAAGPQAACWLGDKDAGASTLLWGDSHALALVPAVDKAFERKGDAAVVAEKSGCPPLLGTEIDLFHKAFGANTLKWLTWLQVRHRPDCQRFNDDVFAWLRTNPPRSVILAGRWASYVESRAKAPDDGVMKVLSDAQSPLGSPNTDPVVFERGLTRTLEALSALHVRIFVVDDVPDFDTSIPYAVAAERRLGLHNIVAVDAQKYAERQRLASQIFAKLAQRYLITFLKPQEFLCDKKTCSAVLYGRPVYLDSNHLSVVGAALITPAFDPIWRISSRAPGQGN